MDRSNWDSDEISKWVKATKSNELKFIARLNEKLAEAGVTDLEVSLHIDKNVGSRKSGSDVVLRYVGDRNRSDVICKIELECGSKQQWDDARPSPNYWRHGITLLTRKDYSQADLFIKHSSTRNSCFVITRGFLEQLIRLGLQARHIESQMTFATNEDKYSIPWHTIRKAEQYLDTTLERGYPDGILWVERNDYSKLVRLFEVLRDARMQVGGFSLK